MDASPRRTHRGDGLYSNLEEVQGLRSNSKEQFEHIGNARVAKPTFHAFQLLHFSPGFVPGRKTPATCSRAPPDVPEGESSYWRGRAGQTRSPAKIHGRVPPHRIRTSRSGCIRAAARRNESECLCKYRADMHLTCLCLKGTRVFRSAPHKFLPCSVPGLRHIAAAKNAGAQASFELKRIPIN